MDELIQQAIDLLRRMWRFRWHSMALLWLLGMSGAVAVLWLPNVYEAQARFYIDAKSRLRDVVHELGMTPNVNSRVFLVRQAMLGRPQLEAVARATDLDLGVATEAEHDAMIRDLLNHISLSTGRSEESQNLFTITYEHESREKAVAVVQELLDAFIERVISAKSDDTERAGTFLQSQLKYYRDLITTVEGQLEAFKQEHPGFVVGTHGNTFDRLQERRANLVELERSYQVELDKREEIRRQLNAVNPYTPGDDEGLVSALIPGSQVSANIRALESQRQDLLLRLTEIHPDVVVLDQQIELLKKKLRQELEKDSGRQSPDGVSSPTNPVYVQIQLVLSQSNLQLTEMGSRLRDLRNQVQELELRLNTAPEIERRYTELTRNYAQYLGLYNEVLVQSERERIGRVGDQQDVVTFNIIDPPQGSILPVSPPRVLLLVAAFVVAAGGAFALAFLLDLFKPTYGTESSVQELGWRVLGTVSTYATPGEHKRRRINLVTFLVVGCAFGAVYGAIMIGVDTGVDLLQRMQLSAR